MALFDIANNASANQESGNWREWLNLYDDFSQFAVYCRACIILEKSAIRRIDFGKVCLLGIQ